jgi:PIN domain nuclease of toxin-antitoxin system
VPWGVSPIALLEIQLLSEIGKLDLAPGFHDAVRSDPRFELDDPPSASLVERAIPLSWTRDPFDRLLAAHSEVRRSPMISVDEEILDNHPLIDRARAEVLNLAASPPGRAPELSARPPEAGETIQGRIARRRGGPEAARGPRR